MRQLLNTKPSSRQPPPILSYHLLPPPIFPAKNIARNTPDTPDAPHCGAAQPEPRNPPHPAPAQLTLNLTTGPKAPGESAHLEPDTPCRTELHKKVSLESTILQPQHRSAEVVPALLYLTGWKSLPRARVDVWECKRRRKSQNQRQQQQQQ